LNFVTRHRNVFTIPKAERIEHVRENAGASGWSLDSEDLRLLDLAFPPPAKDEPLDMI
jgi:diketogulonate reductase-like aldo/keto reductase